MTWEQDFTSDRESYKDSAGKELGYIEPQGASWVVVARDEVGTEPEVICFRPDRETAQRALVRYIKVLQSAT